MSRFKIIHVFSRDKRTARKMAGLCGEAEIIGGIKKAKRVVRELTWLALEIGTLLAVIKMIADSLR